MGDPDQTAEEVFCAVQEAAVGLAGAQTALEKLSSWLASYNLANTDIARLGEKYGIVSRKQLERASEQSARIAQLSRALKDADADVLRLTKELVDARELVSQQEARANLLQLQLNTVVGDSAVSLDLRKACQGVLKAAKVENVGGEGTAWLVAHLNVLKSDLEEAFSASHATRLPHMASYESAFHHLQQLVVKLATSSNVEDASAALHELTANVDRKPSQALLDILAAMAAAEVKQSQKTEFGTDPTEATAEDLDQVFSMPALEKQQSGGFAWCGWQIQLELMRAGMAGPVAVKLMLPSWAEGSLHLNELALPHGEAVQLLSIAAVKPALISLKSAAEAAYRLTHRFPADPAVWAAGIYQLSAGLQQYRSKRPEEAVGYTILGRYRDNGQTFMTTEMAASPEEALDQLFQAVNPGLDWSAYSIEQAEVLFLLRGETRDEVDLPRSKATQEEIEAVEARENR